MPYKNPEEQKEYQRLWAQRVAEERRSAWMSEHGPCECGSWDSLELDHVESSTKDPALKTNSGGGSRTVWLWPEVRRFHELSKCVARCHKCHEEKSKGERAKGVDNGQAKLTEEQVVEIFSSEGTHAEIANRFGVSRPQVTRIKGGKRWKHVNLQNTKGRVASFSN